MDRMAVQRQFYRDSEGRLYQFLTVAVHGETGEELAVYQALYGDYQVFVRPLSQFEDSAGSPGEASGVIFFRTELKGGDDGMAGNAGQTLNVQAEKEPAGPHPLLLRFLEEEELDGQLGALNQMRGKITQRELDSIYFSLDMAPMDGTADQQLMGIIRSLETRRKFDGKRLR